MLPPKFLFSIIGFPQVLCAGADASLCIIARSRSRDGLISYWIEQTRRLLRRNGVLRCALEHRQSEHENFGGRLGLEYRLLAAFAQHRRVMAIGGCPAPRPPPGRTK